MNQSTIVQQMTWHRDSFKQLGAGVWAVYDLMLRKGQTYQGRELPSREGGSMRALTKTDMDMLLNSGCSDPECKDHHHKLDVAYLHSGCHPGYPTWVRYSKDGTLTVECAECDKVICTIKVKEVQ